MKTLKSRIVVITGAGSGIGRSLALESARRGARLALCDVNDTGLAETLTVRVDGEFGLHAGDNVWLTPDADKIHKFDAEGLRIA